MHCNGLSCRLSCKRSVMLVGFYSGEPKHGNRRIVRAAGRRLLGHGLYRPQAAARVLAVGAGHRPLPGLRAGGLRGRAAADDAHRAQADPGGLRGAAAPGLHRQPALLRAAGLRRAARRGGPHLPDHRHPADLGHHHGPARPRRRATVAADVAAAGGGGRHRLHQHRPVRRRPERPRGGSRCGSPAGLAETGRRLLRGRRAGLLDALRGR
ncbi:hypothetical protein D9M72_361620 [compost metagenome]